MLRAAVEALDFWGCLVQAQAKLLAVLAQAKELWQQTSLHTNPGIRHAKLELLRKSCTDRRSALESVKT